MSIYHCSIKIISRAGGRSAVASAAYRAGEKLYNEETGLTHDFTHKKEVAYSEILLPENAPDRLADRSTLWNEVQQVENFATARFAREVEVALPVEMSREEQIKCVHDYVQKNFVNEGMIADWSLHDKDNNPHAHIMLSVRSFNEQGEWNNKKKNFWCNDRDEQGRAIYNPDKPCYDPKRKEETAQYRIPKIDPKTGEQKVRVRKGKGTEYLWEKVDVPVNDWNDRECVEKWREAWAKECNQYLEQENQIDHRSYERQGIDREPTIHEGYSARKIEAAGYISERCEINRDIKAYNSLLDEMKQKFNELAHNVLEKARGLYERIRGIKNNSQDIGGSREDGQHHGESGGGIRPSQDDEFELERGARRNADTKRAISGANKHNESTSREIDTTEQSIAETNRRIAELQQVINSKEREKDERLRKLLQRRSASQSLGTDADGSRGQGQTDTEALIREVKSTISTAGSKEQNSAASRADREHERERQRIEAEQRAREETERKAEIAREKAERARFQRRHSQDHGWSR